jgi:hypothetical protein
MIRMIRNVFFSFSILNETTRNGCYLLYVDRVESLFEDLHDNRLIWAGNVHLHAFVADTYKCRRELLLLERIYCTGIQMPPNLDAR